jgi:haloalkane dehalogenase
MKMTVIRTPDQCFVNLPDFPFKPRYLEVNGMRIHYIDEGKGKPVLCLHGEPTWSFLYRKMVPLLAKTHRVLAFDFVGFGRSDKLTDPQEYSFDLHRQTLIGFIDALELNEITVVVHDWGGLIGLRVVTELPDRFARLVILNTFLPTGEERPSKAFLSWREMVERMAPDLPIGSIMRRALPNATAEIIAAYEAPFPTTAYKAGAVAWPLMVPLEREQPVAAEMRKTREVLSHWEKPALIMFSDNDPILGGAHAFFREMIPSSKKQPEIIIRGAGHFLQEEKGAEIALHILAFMEKPPATS